MFENLPVARKAVKYQRRCRRAHTAATRLAANKKFRHPIVRARRSARCVAGRNDSETRRPVAAQDCQHVNLAVGKPAHEMIGCAVANLTQSRKEAGMRRRQIVQILAVDAFDPDTISRHTAGVADCDRHDLSARIGEPNKNKARANGIPSHPGFVISLEGILLFRRVRRNGSGGSVRRGRGSVRRSRGSGRGGSGSVRRGRGSVRGSNGSSVSGRSHGVSSRSSFFLLGASNQSEGRNGGCECKFRLHFLSSPKS